MLTLVKTKDAISIVGIYSGKNARKPDETVYFTHETEKDNQNVAKAEGVLHLHRNELKKEFRLNDGDFKEVCRMIDAEEATRWGMASVMLPDDELIEHAQQAMKTIASHPQPAVLLARESLRANIEGNNMRAAELGDIDRFLLLSQLKDTARKHQDWRDGR